MSRRQRYYEDERVSHRGRNTTIWSVLFMIVMAILEAFLRGNNRTMVPPPVRNWGRGRGRSGSSGFNAAPPPPSRNDSGGSTGSWGDSGSGGGRGFGGAGGSLDGKSGDTW